MKAWKHDDNLQTSKIVKSASRQALMWHRCIHKVVAEKYSTPMLL